MDNFESELNIIHQLLKNDETYTKLIIEDRHREHFNKYKSEYYITYNCNGAVTFKNTLIDILDKNTHVNEIYMTVCNFGFETACENNKFVKKIIKIKSWKSVYMFGESDSVLDALLSQQNPQLIKLKLSQIFTNGHKLVKLFQNTNRWFIGQSLTPSLKIFELNISTTLGDNFTKIIEAIQKSNIKTVIISNIHCELSDFEFINNLFNCKIMNLHLNDLRYKCEFNLTHNYTLMNFTVNGIQPNYAQETLNRNKNYVFTVLLCMNRKIIPRCVFKSLILKDLFIV